MYPDQEISCEKKINDKNHSTQDSRVVPHRGTNWAALWLTAQIRRDAVLSESYGRGYQPCTQISYMLILLVAVRLRGLP